MTKSPDLSVKEFMQKLKNRTKGETEFHQAVQEVVETVIPFINANPKYKESNILERLTEPERIISFRVCWEDDNGDVQVNRGYRVQFSSSIGPYKGGLRFHPSVNQSILKFLGFEQILKNSLTTLPMGAGKGGADFDPKGKSDKEVMRFCQAFMRELSKHIGQFTDVPAGDIGVGAREIGYLYGYYKTVRNEVVGVLTGKSLEFGGSLIRPEATGYGTVYFLNEMLIAAGKSLSGKTVAISGSGNVAQYAAEKVLQLGGKVLTFSDSSGFIYEKEGFDAEKINFLKYLKNEKRGRVKEYCDKYSSAEFFAKERPWKIPCDVALPCATQNEIDENDAKNLVANKCIAISEGANMPTTPEAIEIILANKILYAPGKASNAGGVAVSGLEMSQNSLRISWTKEEVDQKLQDIMKNIHAKCVEYGTEGSHINYIKGANIAGFIKVADAMLAYGTI